jgi:hypothetical protein
MGSLFMPSHKFKANFLEYYEEYVKQNARNGTATWLIALRSLSCASLFAVRCLFGFTMPKYHVFRNMTKKLYIRFLFFE